jgi:glycosyltransferase involved in cell wall biosynthesis
MEHLVVDGGSNDGTLDIIRAYDGRISKWISEPDKGIYDAMNKGIRLSSGDVIGFLQSDDVYAHERVVENVVEAFRRFEVDSVYGDLQYVHKRDLNKVVRNWKASVYREGRFKSGWMPPHPTFFVKRMVYDRFGYFNTNFRIAADYELMLRFLEKHKISTHYIPEVLVKMRVGGASNGSVKNMLVKSYEDYRAWKVNGLKRSFFTIPLKNLSKVPQFLQRQIKNPG